MSSSVESTFCSFQTDYLHTEFSFSPSVQIPKNILLKTYRQFYFSITDAPHTFAVRHGVLKMPTAASEETAAIPVKLNLSGNYRQYGIQQQ